MPDAKAPPAATDLYAVLGLDPSATSVEIKRAHLAGVRACHPDVHPADPAAPERLLRLQEAYRVLSDPERRARYDQARLAAPFAPAPEQSLPDLGERVRLAILELVERVRAAASADD